MDDLIAWLRAQLDDDERVALNSQDEPGNFYPDGHYGAVRVFLERWNPLDATRVLAEVDAKRRILDWLEDCERKALDGNWWNLEVEDAVRALALPYADRDGYRDDWRP